MEGVVHFESKLMRKAEKDIHTEGRASGTCDRDPGLPRALPSLSCGSVPTRKAGTLLKSKWNTAGQLILG